MSQRNIRDINDEELVRCFLGEKIHLASLEGGLRHSAVKAKRDLEEFRTEILRRNPNDSILISLLENSADDMLIEGETGFANRERMERQILSTLKAPLNELIAVFSSP